jgi:hypothetical protein
MKKQKQMTLGVSLACAIFCGSVLADPKEGGPASCAGYEAADVSPPGSESGPFSAFGMRGILAFIDTVIIPALGLSNRGEAIRALSAAHEGSHEDCDEALGIPPGGE